MTDDLLQRINEMIEIMLDNEDEYYVELEHAYEIQQSLSGKLDE